MLDVNKEDEILSFEKKIKELSSELVNSPESIHLRLLNICSSFSSKLTAEKMSEVLFSVNHNLYDAKENKNGDNDKDPNSDVSIEDIEINIDLADLDAESSDENPLVQFKKLLETLKPEKLKELLGIMSQESIRKDFDVLKLPFKDLLNFSAVKSEITQGSNQENSDSKNQHAANSQPSQSR